MDRNSGQLLWSYRDRILDARAICMKMTESMRIVLSSIFSVWTLPLEI